MWGATASQEVKFSVLFESAELPSKPEAAVKAAGAIEYIAEVVAYIVCN